MMNSHEQNIMAQFHSLVVREYGDEYPILFLESKFSLEKSMKLQDLAKGDDSVHFISDFGEVFTYANDLQISFVVISPSDVIEEQIFLNSHMFPFHHSRRMFDLEEEMLLKDVFKGISDETRNSLEAYVFFVLEEIKIEAPPVNEDEEEVMVMRNIKDMAKEFQQEYVVIWYDPNASPEDREILTKEVDIESNNIYTDFNVLCQRIYDPNNVPCHLIMTNKVEAEKIRDEIDNKLNDSVLCLYIYYAGHDFVKRRNCRIFVEPTVENLIPKIKEGIRSKSKLVNSFPAFATDFDASDRSDVYNLHYYLKGLINFKNRKQAKGDFINLAKKIYESKKLFEFEKSYNDYNKNEIFKWYTKDSPVYKVLNNCLRIATPDSILYCRYITRDLERAIKEEYKEKSHEYNGVVFRGAYISKDEWEKLQRNVGKEIEMYGFLSTSKDLNVAKDFVYKDFGDKILISIIIPPLPDLELNEQGFADISKNSGFQEDEILFNVRSKFQILETGNIKINDQGKKCRHLVLMYGAQLLRKEMTQNKPSLSIEFELPPDLKCSSCQAKSNLFAFQKEMVEVCCFKCLPTKSLPEDLPLIALESSNSRKILKEINGAMLNFNVKNDLPFYGYKCKDCQGTGKKKYMTWKDLNNGEVKRQCFECFQKSKKIESQLLICESNPYTFWTEHQAEWETIQSDYQSSEELLNEQYSVYREVQRFDLCIKYEKRIIKKLNRKRNREVERIESFCRLAKAYKQSGLNKEASAYFERLLKFNKEVFGEDDKRIVEILEGLAFVYQDMEEYQKAEEYLTKVLKMKDGNEDPSLAFSLNLFAGRCKILGKHKEALEYHQRALKIFRVQFGEKHPNTAMSYHNLASVYEDKGECQEAFNYYQKALSIQESIFGAKHRSTISTYNNLGTLNEMMGRYQEALDWHLKVVNHWISIYGEIHLHVATSYNNLGVLYRKLNEYQKAREFHQKALGIVKDVSGEKESEISATSYADLGMVCQALKQFYKAKDYFSKALEGIKSVFGENHRKTALSYNNLGDAYLGLHQYLEAKELILKAVDITISIYGENHPNIPVCYNNLAVAYDGLGDNEIAMEYSFKACKVAKSIYGESHYVTTTAQKTFRRLHQGQVKSKEQLIKQEITLKRFFNK